MTTPSISAALANAPKNWGRWGPDDEIGAINFLTPAEAVRGAGEIRTGKRFPIGLEILRPGGDPTIPIRGQPRKFMTSHKGHFSAKGQEGMPGGLEWSDDLVMMFIQGSTHIDALGHVWYDDQLYNGYPADTTIGGLDKCSVKPLADHGIAGRGVLLDIARHRNVEALGDNEQIPLAELHATAAAQGVAIERHDILLIRTGRMGVFYREGLEAFMGAGHPGISDEPELIAWFHEMEFPTFGSDTIPAEQTVSSVSGCRCALHGALLRNLGVPFIELLWLEDLAADCAEDGQYTFMLVASPLKLHGATGSPLNPIAIK